MMSLLCKTKSWHDSALTSELTMHVLVQRLKMSMKQFIYTVQVQASWFGQDYSQTPATRKHEFTDNWRQNDGAQISGT